MTMQATDRADKLEAPGVLWRGYFTLAEREERIRVAAYYRYLARGAAPGHALDDWLAAEWEIDHGRVRERAAPEVEEQQSSRHGVHTDEAIKRLIRQHPQQAIPRVEGIGPGEVPARQ